MSPSTGYAEPFSFKVLFWLACLVGILKPCQLPKYSLVLFAMCFLIYPRNWCAYLIEIVDTATGGIGANLEM